MEDFSQGLHFFHGFNGSYGLSTDFTYEHRQTTKLSKTVLDDLPDKKVDMRYLVRQLLAMNAFLNTLYETLQKVSAEIFSKVKKIISLYEQSVKLDSIKRGF